MGVALGIAAGGTTPPWLTAHMGAAEAHVRAHTGGSHLPVGLDVSNCQHHIGVA